MKGLLLLSILLVSTSFIFGQTTISGKVLDKKGEAIPGANVYLKNTYDGTSSDATGKYSLKTTETGPQILEVSFIGFKTDTFHLVLSGKQIFKDIRLAEELNKLDAVVITAGSFEASDEKKMVILRPLDIVTTSSAMGDLAGALNTLPGTQKNGETGRLFVRGGESYETKVFIDGLYVQSPFNTSAPSVPSRTRFSPMLFRGTNFSTGGYSAEYGQALSSALSLNTIEFPVRSQTDLSLMSVGGSLSHTQYGKRTSGTAEIAHTNLKPYFGLLGQKFNWTSAPVNTDVTLSLRHKIRETGLLKFYAMGTNASLGVFQTNPSDITTERKVEINNNYLHLNTNYKDMFGGWVFKAGSSFTVNAEKFDIGADKLNQKEKSLHFKSTLQNQISEAVSLTFGAENITHYYDQNFFQQNTNSNYNSSFTDQLSVAFAETEIYLTQKIAGRIGVRTEYSSLLNKGSLSPRLSFAYKAFEKGQFSMAYGRFYQSPESEHLRFNNKLNFEWADHYILNFQRTSDHHTFRVEAYYKDYNALVKYNAADIGNPLSINNNGNGFAKGVDVFWRDKKTVKRTDYWVSYSYLDTKRNYRDFTESRIPSFASTHNFSLVVKHFIPAIKSQLGLTNSFTSGRTFIDPNSNDTNKLGKTAFFNDLSLSCSYLYRPNMILFTSLSNVLGRDNVFGYIYNPSPDSNGVYQRKEIGQGATRFFFVGIFITLSKDKNANQLNNL